MDLDTVSPDAFWSSLRGLGINILVSNVPRCIDFLTYVFAMRAHQGSADFAIMVYQSQVFQLHSDATYAAHPLQALLPENPLRGLGVELRLYDSDPDTAAVQAEAMGAMILQAPSDKPHGLRDCAILGPDGYLWVPSRPL